MNQSTKSSQCWRGLCSLIALVMAFAATSVNADFCLTTLYDRGVGKVPAACADAGRERDERLSGRVIDEGLCYKKCDAGWDGKATNCVQNCPAGWRDDGLFCGKPAAGAPYGVGAGYGWKVGDGPSNYDPAGARCRADNTGVGCSKEGLIWYPNCKTGYKKSGLLICSPEPVQCPSGFKDIGVSCTKPIVDRGLGVIPSACGGGEQLEDGLCYTGCKPGNVGVGPICWQHCSRSAPVSCGNSPVPLGCASSQAECVKWFLEPVSAKMELISRELAILRTTEASRVKAAIASVISASARAIVGLSQKQAIDLISAQALLAGVSFTWEQSLNLANALVGGDFDPTLIEFEKVNAMVKVYKKPMSCKS